MQRNIHLYILFVYQIVNVIAFSENVTFRQDKFYERKVQIFQKTGIVTMTGRNDIPSIWVVLTLMPAMSRMVGPRSMFVTSSCQR